MARKPAKPAPAAKPDVSTRGEVTITLDATYTMRPSYAAIEAIEEQTGHGLIALINLAQTGEMSIGVAAIIVTECIKAWGQQLVAAGDASPEARAASGANAKKVGQLLHEAGQMAVLPRIVLVLLAAATGGVTATGEMKPAADTTETRAAG